MRKIGMSFRKPKATEPGYYCLMIVSSVYMPQGGSLQRSRGLQSKGPVLVERVGNMPFRGPNNAKIAPKWGFEPKNVATRAVLFARAHGA